MKAYLYIHVKFRTFTLQCAIPQKNPYPPYGRSSGIPKGRGVLKAKILEAKYEGKLECLGGQVWGRIFVLRDLTRCFDQLRKTEQIRAEISDGQNTDPQSMDYPDGLLKK